MALINCDECGNKVSDKAVSCPNCGNPIAKNVSKKNTIINSKNFTINIFAILSLIITILLLTFLPPSSKTSYILFIVPFILSILGILTSSKIKKDLGKNKGLFISIITLTISTLVFISFIDTYLLSPTSTVNNSQELSTRDIVIYNQINYLKKSLNNPNSFQLYNVYVYSANKNSLLYDTYSEYFNVIVDYSGENLMGGTTRKYMVYQYQTNKGDNNSNIKLRYYKDYSDFDDAAGLAKTSCNGFDIPEGSTTTLNVDDILNYINTTN